MSQEHSVIHHCFQDVVALIFDCDGVLLPESERINLAAAIKTFTDLGFPLKEEEMAEVIGRSSRMFFPPLLEKRGVTGERVHEIITLNRVNYDSIWPGDATIDPELVETLQHLQHEEILLAIATMNRRTIIDRFLGSMLPIPNPFSVILTAEDVTHHKPHPEVYERAALLLDAPREQTLVVEDQTIGIRAAKAAGLRCVAVRNSTNAHMDLSEADYCLASLRDLCAIRRRRNAQ